MEYSKIFIIFFVILLSSNIVIAEDIKTVDEKTIITQKIDLVSALSVDVEKISVSDIDINITLSKDSSKAKFKSLKNIDDIEHIIFNPNLKEDTSSIYIDSKTKLNFTSALLTLKKNKFGVVTKIMNSPNGLNYTTVNNMRFKQNSTHVWFNVTHFSSWTGTMDDIYLFQDILDNSGFKEIVEIDLDDFSTIDAGDCVGMDYHDRYEDSDYSENNCAGNNFNTIVYSDNYACYGDEIYRFSIYETTNVIDFALDDDCDASYDDGYGFDRFLIYTPSGVGSGRVDINIKSAFNHPDISITYSDIADTTATLKCTPDYDDLGNLQYYDYATSGDKEMTFFYKKTSDPTYTELTSQTTSDGILNDEDLTGLTVGTSYTFYCVFDYYDLTNGNGGDWSDTTTTTRSFTTTGGTVEPTVETVSSITDDESVSFKGSVDFGTYTGGDIGLAFNYSVKDSGTWIRLPTTGFYVASDDVIYTSDTEIGLSNGVNYEWNAFIRWDSGVYRDIGSTKYFTPQPATGSSGSGADVSKMSFYDEFDDASLDAAIWSISSGSPTVSDSVLTMDGSSARQKIVNTSALVNTDKTEFTIRLELNDLPSSQRIINDVGIATDKLLEWWITSSGDIEYYDTGAQTACSSCVSDGDIIELTYDGTDVEYFVNGVSEHTQTVFYVINLNNYVQLDTTGATGGITKVDNYYIWNGTRADYPASVPAFTPQVTALEPIAITYNSANLRGVSTFNASVLSNTNASFELKTSEASSFLPAPPLFSISTDVIYSYTWLNLTPATEYEFRTYVQYNSSEGNIAVISDSLFFNTTYIPPPLITTDSALNVTYQNATLKGSITNIYAWDDVDVYFNITKDGSANYTKYEVITGTNLTQSFYKTIVGLDELTDYNYFMYVDYNNSIVKGYEVQFTTSELGAPIINTLSATNILRETATISGAFVDLGIYSSVDIYFHYYNTTHDFNTSPITYVIDDLEISEALTDLVLNTSYSYEMKCLYSGNNLISGGILTFTTLSLSDFIPPNVLSVIVDDDDVSFNSSFVQAIINIEDANETRLSFYLYDSSGILILNSFSPIQNITESGIYSYTFSNLTQNTKYYYAPVITYNLPNATLPFVSYVYGEKISFTTLDNIDSPKFVSIFPNFKVWVDDPYLFMLILLSSFSIVGLISAFVMSQATTMNIKLLIYILGAGTFILMIWGYMQDIYPLWELTINSLITILLGFYYFKSSSSGAVYG